MYFLVFFHSFRRRDVKYCRQNKGSIPLQDPSKSNKPQKNINIDRIWGGNMEILIPHIKCFRLMYELSVAQKYTQKISIPWSIILGEIVQYLGVRTHDLVVKIVQNMGCNNIPSFYSG